jgi:hypothetical protein
MSIESSVTIVIMFIEQSIRLFVLVKPFQAGLIFAGKAGSLPKRGAPAFGPILKGSGLTWKY